MPLKALVLAADCTRLTRDQSEAPDIKLFYTKRWIEHRGSMEDAICTDFTVDLVLIATAMI